MTMLVCASYFDIERATQWVQAMDRFIERYGCPFLDAECRTNYGRVLFENGDWSGAAEQFLVEVIANVDDDPGLARDGVGNSGGASPRGGPDRGGRGEAPTNCMTARRSSSRWPRCISLATNPRWPRLVLRRRLGAVGSNRLDAAVVVDLLGHAEITPGQADDAARRGEALVLLGNANDCHLIIGHGRRLLGLASAGVDPAAARAHLEAALIAFSRAEVPYRAAQSAPCDRADCRGGTDVEVAAAEARSALTVFEDLGASREADDAAAFLRDLGMKWPGSGPKNVGRLIENVQEVLGLLGALGFPPGDRRASFPVTQDRRASRCAGPFEARSARTRRGGGVRRPRFVVGSARHR